MTTQEPEPNQAHILNAIIARIGVQASQTCVACLFVQPGFAKHRPLHSNLPSDQVVLLAGFLDCPQLKLGSTDCICDVKKLAQMTSVHF